MVRSNVVARPSPRKIEQLIARQHPLRMFDEREEHVELRGTEIDQRVRRRTQLPSRHVKAPAGKLEDPTSARRRSGYGHRRAPQDGTNAGQQFVDAKWFGKVIVGAHFEAEPPDRTPIPFAVSMMIGMVPLARSRRQMLRPSSPGIMTPSVKVMESSGGEAAISLPTNGLARSRNAWADASDSGASTANPSRQDRRISATSP